MPVRWMDVSADVAKYDAAQTAKRWVKQEQNVVWSTVTVNARTYSCYFLASVENLSLECCLVLIVLHQLILQ